MKYRCYGKSSLWVIAVLVVLAGVVVWYLTVKQPKIKNVILISLDTCRADYLGCYGFEKNTSPNIDALAAEGLVFENAFTPIPLTLPAHSSMFTGTYPPYHKVHDNINYKLDKSNITIAEILREKGYATAAIISSYVLYPQFGTGQGFGSYNNEFIDPIVAGTNRDTERRGGETSEFACRYLDKHKKEPFFLFLHYYDPHADYDPPEPFASQFSDDLYSGEIAYTDYCLGQVIDKLKAMHLYDSTLIIIVGDHGEALGEHGETEHGYFIYQCSTRVPFIIKVPGLRKGKRIEDVASLVDVVPTILSYLEIDIADYIQGHDLSVYGTAKNDVNPQRQVYTESLIPTKYGCNPLLGLLETRFEYIKTTRPELYDMVEDKGDENNLIKNQTKRAKLMNAKLNEFTSRIVGTAAISGKIELDEASRRRLESLGYVGAGSLSDSLEFDNTKKDPKDLIGYYDNVQKVTRLKYKAKYAEAEAMCQAMLKDWPQIPNTNFQLTQIAYSQENMEKTIKYGTDFLAMVEGTVDLSLEATGINPTKDIAMAHNLIGQATFELGKYDMAIEHWNKALGFKTNWPEVHNNIAGAFYKAGNMDKAIEHWRMTLRLVPGWKEVQNNLNALLRQKEREKTIAALEKKVKVNPDDAETHNELGKIFYRSGQFDKVVLHWSEVLRINPADEKVCNNLAWVLAAGKDDTVWDAERAMELAEQACELTEYKQPEMLDTLGVAYAAAGRFEEAKEITEKAIELALSEGENQVAGDIETRMQLYKKKQAYRD